MLISGSTANIFCYYTPDQSSLSTFALEVLSLRMPEITPVKHQSMITLYVSNLIGLIGFFPYLSKLD